MPTIAEVLQQGWQLHQTGKLPEAERVYRHVLAQAPRNPEALVYLGILLFDSRRFEESAQSYRAALTLRSEFPIAWNNLGNSLRMLGELDEAETCFANALQQDPKYLSAYKNRGTLWIWSGHIDRGLRWYEEGLKIEPDEAELHRNLGVIYLLQGDNDRGWPEYRWRWRMPGVQRPIRTSAPWSGEPIKGKTILLFPEQGRGDEMHLVRMADVLYRAGARVALMCDPKMIPLFTSVHGVESLLPLGTPAPPVDFHASLFDAVDGWYQMTGELPYAPEAFVDHGTHRGYLNVSDALVHYWHHWMEQNGLGAEGRFRVGIAWQGNPSHHADVYRSMPLETLAPLAEIQGIQLVNLQFGFGSDQLTTCSFADSIDLLPDDIDTSGGAFTDTAAVLKNLDLVVTTDTSLVHLAGALGVDTTLMLGKVPDWRWLQSGETTPWYPSLRLVRQSQMGDWSDVVEQVVARIRSKSG
ncbi:tetratricopeptide repeat protein [Stieleria varia]|uniref:Tetratricopeptide repeat protein n=1 Tax=Stieleria varia TaxID=2528005 RepID=A0A5C6A0I5_9BACT|nr:tetratricopeptide repeat-containing glycosyltransferase family protein [Stieleria varia]TWT92708.1 Tetratricopeptide repeat protein [Stieleria varia]